MRVELRTRDDELLGHLDLLVAPAVAQQALMHTQVVLGPVVDEGAAAELDGAAPSAQQDHRRRRKAGSR